MSLQFGAGAKVVLCLCRDFTYDTGLSFFLNADISRHLAALIAAGHFQHAFQGWIPFAENSDHAFHALQAFLLCGFAAAGDDRYNQYNKYN